MKEGDERQVKGGRPKTGGKGVVEYKASKKKKNWDEGKARQKESYGEEG